MLRVLIESDGIRNFDRHMPDLHFNSQRTQGRHELFVELGHRARDERDDLACSVAGPDDQVVIDEIEFHFEHTPLVGNCGSSKAPGADIERNFPPVIYIGTQR